MVVNVYVDPKYGKIVDEDVTSQLTYAFIVGSIIYEQSLLIIDFLTLLLTVILFRGHLFCVIHRHSFVS